MPRRGWALLIALVMFSVAVLSVLYWAQFTGRAGSQRGLVIRNEANETFAVSIEHVQTQTIYAKNQETFVVKRSQFPALLTWWGEDGAERGRRELDYAYIADAEFRLSIDENGVYHTQETRDTPVPTRS